MASRAVCFYSNSLRFRLAEPPCDSGQDLMQTSLQKRRPKTGRPEQNGTSFKETGSLKSVDLAGI